MPRQQPCTIPPRPLCVSSRWICHLNRHVNLADDMQLFAGVLRFARHLHFESCLTNPLGGALYETGK